MKKILSLFLALLLCMGIAGTAAAELTATATMVAQFDDDYAIMQREVNLVQIRKGDAYTLVDINGQIITEDTYRNINTNSSTPWLTCEVPSDDPYNTKAVFDANGQRITTNTYGMFRFISDRWFACSVLVPAGDLPYDQHTNAGDARESRIDIYYCNKLVASLDRSEYNGTSAYGDYLYLNAGYSRGINLVIQRDGTQIAIDDDHYHLNEYRSISDLFYTNTRYWHHGSQQYAFEPGCTLTQDEVQDWLMYNGKGQMIDLQGNVVCYLEGYDSTHSGVATICEGGYFSLYSNGHYCIFDMNGNLIASEAVANTTNPAWSGYILCQDHEENLYYVTTDGSASADFSVPRAEIDLVGILRDMPFLYTKPDADGLITVYTAPVGKLETRYEEVAYDGYSITSRLLGVKKDGKFGVIDLYGNTVIDFLYSDVIISHDGTMVATKNWQDDYIQIYRIDYTDPAAEAAMAVWHCDPCDRDNDMNFCPSCGAAKPVKLVCSGCGYEPEDQSFRFCPSCGQQF